MDIAAIFDLDGVIVDNKAAHEEAFKVFLERKGKTLEEGQYQEDIQGKHNDEIFPYLFPGSTNIDEMANEKESIYRALYADDIRPVSGLLGFLTDLDEHDVPKALATNAPKENITFVLTQTKTLPHFPVVVHPDDVERGKPDPGMYLLAAERLSVRPGRCIVFEDSLPGIEAARRAGMHVVGVATSHTREELHEADMVIGDFTEISVADLRRLFEK